MTTRQPLAETYLAEGRVKDALSQYKRVLADRERVLGRDHLDTIAARGNLGSAYHAAGRMASAVRLYEETGPVTTRCSAPITRTPWPAASAWPPRTTRSAG